VRDIVRQIAMEHDLLVNLGKVARDHVHVFCRIGRTSQQ
jgi:hypothetical protein